MPILETPPNPVPPHPSPSEPEKTSAKVRTRRFGELEEDEIIHLIDTLDDERERARFRESVYISVFFWIVVAWFVFYGPRVLFHQPQLVNPADVLKQRELTNLNVPEDIRKALQHAPKQAAGQKAPPPPRTNPDRKTLQALRKQEPPPPAPQPPPPPPQTQAVPTPLPQQRPTPPVANAPLPSAPSPSPQPTRPNFSTPSTPGDMIQQATRGARGGGLDLGGGPGRGVTRSSGLGGPEILSDTMGVDFNPYLQKILRMIQETWYPLIPEEARPPLNKRGETQIRITIMPDGRLHIQDGVNNGMVLEGSTHDDAINKSCWGSITGVGQFPPLPSEFHGPNLVLRLHYFVNEEPK